MRRLGSRCASRARSAPDEADTVSVCVRVCVCVCERERERERESMLASLGIPVYFMVG